MPDDEDPLVPPEEPELAPEEELPVAPEPEPSAPESKLELAPEPPSVDPETVFGAPPLPKAGPSAGAEHAAMTAATPHIAQCKLARTDSLSVFPTRQQKRITLESAHRAVAHVPTATQ